MSEKMTDCHDWFAEVAETYVRYIVAKAGFEVFGQSEWGADLAIRDSETKTWVRCEVRSSDCNTEPGRKASKKLADCAELTGAVTLENEMTLQVIFHKLNKAGRRIQLQSGGPALHHRYRNAGDLREWLRQSAFPIAQSSEPEARN